MSSDPAWPAVQLPPGAPPTGKGEEVSPASQRPGLKAQERHTPTRGLALGMAKRRDEAETKPGCTKNLVFFSLAHYALGSSL